jgi:outer membrane protein assembly factor BamB
MNPGIRTVLFAVAVALATPGAVFASDTQEQPGAVGTSTVLAKVDLAGPLEWFFPTDVGLLLVYGDGRLHRMDLLAADGASMAPIAMPGLSKPGSVVPVGRTGILLVADAPAGALPGGTPGARPSSSYGVDLLAGKVVWEADPLPIPDSVLSYPEDGFAVLRSAAGGGSVVAVDLATGQQRWRHAAPVRMWWSDAAYIRLLTGNSLWTVTAASGEIIRRDVVALPEDSIVIPYTEEGVLVAWDNKNLEAVSLPPVPPAEPAPSKPLWSFRAEGMITKLCIELDVCRVDRVPPNRIVVHSGGHSEALEIKSGKRLFDHKWRFAEGGLEASRGGSLFAVPGGDGLRLFDGVTAAERAEIPYPKGGEGLKLDRSVSWLTDDIAVIVFPDSHGAPRRMTAFSTSQKTVLWTLALPEAAEYHLTSQQKGQLFGRIALALVATAVSAANPMSVGGYNYSVVAVPSLDVSRSLPEAGAVLRAAPGEGTGAAAPYPEAAARLEACRAKLPPDGPGYAQYVVGPKGKYDILEIDRSNGNLRTAGRYEAEKVHAIALYSPFDRALSLENDNRSLRLIALAPTPEP